MGLSHLEREQEHRTKEKGRGWGRSAPSIPARPSSPRPTHRVRLVLATVQLVTVVEDVLVGGVEAGFHAVLHHLAGSWGALQLLDLGVRGERGAGGRPAALANHPGATSQHNPSLAKK